MAYRGLRRGELSGLHIQDLDLPRAFLRVQQTVVADEGYQCIEVPKDYEHRSILIPEFLITMLEQQVAGRPGLQPVNFGMRTKTCLSNHTFRKGWFDPAATEIGLTGITPHELRHTAAMTLDTYADLFDDDLDNVASVLNEIAFKPHVNLLVT